MSKYDKNATANIAQLTLKTKRKKTEANDEKGNRRVKNTEKNYRALEEKRNALCKSGGSSSGTIMSHNAQKSMGKTIIAFLAKTKSLTANQTFAE